MQQLAFVALGANHFRCDGMAGLNVIRCFALGNGRFSILEWLTLSNAAAAIFFAFLYFTCWGTTWPVLLPKFWTAVFCGLVANVIVHFLNAKAASIDAGDVSLTAPL